MGWAIVLYFLEVLTLIGIPAMLCRSQYGPIEVTNGTRIIGMLALVVTFVAIWQLSSGSAAQYATELGTAFALLQLVTIPNFIAEMVRGYVMYTRRRAFLVALGSLTGIVLTTMLAFGG